MKRALVFLLVASAALICARTSTAQQLTISPPSGTPAPNFNLVMECAACDAIYYTEDGSQPTPESQQYSQPIPSATLAYRDSTLAKVPTTLVPNVSDGAEYYAWRAPSVVEMAHTISARGYANGKPITGTQRVTYLTGPNHQLPVFSLMMEPAALVDPDTGIYVPGVHCDSTNSVWTGNYHQAGKKWERTAALHYFENGELALEQNVGVRIHGLKVGAAPQKSLRLYARKRLGGKRLERPFFGARIGQKRLLLRSPFSAHRSTMITDAVVHELCRPLNLEIMAYQPALVYLNGEYWGLHMARERVDDHYIADRFGLDNDSVLIKEAAIPVFEETLARVEALDLSGSEAYEQVRQWIDVHNFIDYVVAETYFRNKDWLEHDNNTTFWKPKTGGKWRFVIIDMDACFQRPEQDMFDFMKTHSGSYVSRLYRKLCENARFKAEFQARYSGVVNGPFGPKRAMAVIDSISALVEPELARQVERWHHPATRTTYWNAIDGMRAFANQRLVAVDGHLKREFNVAESYIDTKQSVWYLSHRTGNILFAACSTLVLALLAFVIRRIRKRMWR